MSRLDYVMPPSGSSIASSTNYTNLALFAPLLDDGVTDDGPFVQLAAAAAAAAGHQALYLPGGRTCQIGTPVYLNSATDATWTIFGDGNSSVFQALPGLECIGEPYPNGSTTLATWTNPSAGQTFTLTDPIIYYVKSLTGSQNCAVWVGTGTGGNFVPTEQILCQFANDGLTATVVQRGYNGTGTRTHTAGDNVQIAGPGYMFYVNQISTWDSTHHVGATLVDSSNTNNHSQFGGSSSKIRLQVHDITHEGARNIVGGGAQDHPTGFMFGNGIVGPRFVRCVSDQGYHFYTWHQYNDQCSAIYCTATSSALFRPKATNILLDQPGFLIYQNGAGDAQYYEGMKGGTNGYILRAGTANGVTIVSPVGGLYEFSNSSCINVVGGGHHEVANSDVNTARGDFEGPPSFYSVNSSGTIRQTWWHPAIILAGSTLLTIDDDPASDDYSSWAIVDDFPSIFLADDTSAETPRFPDINVIQMNPQSSLVVRNTTGTSHVRGDGGEWPTSLWVASRAPFRLNATVSGASGTFAVLPLTHAIANGVNVIFPVQGVTATMAASAAAGDTSVQLTSIVYPTGVSNVPSGDGGLAVSNANIESALQINGATLQSTMKPMVAAGNFELTYHRGGYAVVAPYPHQGHRAQTKITTPTFAFDDGSTGPTFANVSTQASSLNQQFYGYAIAAYDELGNSTAISAASTKAQVTAGTGWITIPITNNVPATLRIWSDNNAVSGSVDPIASPKRYCEVPISKGGQTKLYDSGRKLSGYTWKFASLPSTAPVDTMYEDLSLNGVRFNPWRSPLTVIGETVRPENLPNQGTNNANFGGANGGRLMGCLIWLVRGSSASSISWFSGTTALTAGTTPHLWFGLYRTDTKALIGQSTDDTAPVWAASSELNKSLASGPFTIPYTGWYYATLMIAGTTTTFPSFLGGSQNAVTAAILPMGANSTNVGGKCWNTADTGLTTTAPNPYGAFNAVIGYIPYVQVKGTF